MSRNRNKRLSRMVEEQPVAPEQEQAVPQEAPPEGEHVNLADVAFMVMVGRYKDGTPFLANVNVADVFTVGGMLDYAQTEIRHNYGEHFKNRG